MSAPSHDELAGLVAAYALDALDPGEAALVEDHLRDCPRCRAELADHRDTAALLGYGGGDAPEGVWERIAADIAPGSQAPPMRLVVGQAQGSGSRRRRWAARGLGSAAAAVIAVMAVGLVHTEHRVGQLNAALADSRVLERATAAALDPRARRLALTSWNGHVLAAAAVLPDGTGYVLPSGLGTLPASRTYQLWSIAGGHPVSAGLLGSDPRVLAFRLAPDASVIAVTDEPAGGSSRPTGSPLASATI